MKRKLYFCNGCFFLAIILLLSLIKTEQVVGQCPLPVPSLIPNPSGEILSACPTGENQVYLATPWFNASAKSPDYLNICGFNSHPQFSPPPTPTFGNGCFGIHVFNTSEATPLISSSVLEHEEDIGVCLPTPLIPGVGYTFQFHLTESSLGVNIRPDLGLWGTTNCSSNPNIITWVYLGEINTTLNSSIWIQHTFNFIAPSAINGLRIGISPQAFNNDDIRRYYFLDNFILNTNSAFQPPIAEAGPNKTISCNNLSVVLNGSVVNGAPPYTYSWTPSLGLSNSSIANPIASPNSTRTYTLNVTAANGCTSSDMVTVNVNLGTGPNWVWTGAVSNNWFDGCNWSRGVVPDCKSEVIIPGGTPTNPEIIGAAAGCSSIEINTANGGHVYLRTSQGGELRVTPGLWICP